VYAAVSLVGGALAGYVGVIATGLASAAVVAVAVPSVTGRRLPVEVRRELYPLRVERGQIAVGLLTVVNASTRGQRLSARERCGDSDIPVGIGYLPPGGSTEVRYALPTSRRGVIEIGPLRWDRTDPLGLLVSRSAATGTATLRVHPVVHRFPLAAAARTSHGEQARTDLAPEGSITFHQLREYLPGDDLRRIHWRASAHRGELMVRQNIDVTPPSATVLLVTEPAAYPDPEEFEHAVEVAASAALGAVRAGHGVALWTTGGLRLTANGGADDAVALMDRLTEVRLTAGAGLAATAAAVEHGKRGGALVVAAGRVGAAELGAVHRAAGRFGVAVLVRCGAGVGTQPAGGRGRGLTVVEAATAAEACERWERLAGSLVTGVVR
jgi:uncharacterized protein (DUF58 family)